MHHVFYVEFVLHIVYVLHVLDFTALHKQQIWAYLGIKVGGPEWHDKVSEANEGRIWFGE